MKNLFEKVYGTYYTAAGKANHLGDWVLESKTPREILLKVIGGENAPKEFLIDKESNYIYFAEDLQECDEVRMLFEQNEITLTLRQVIDIWDQHSEDLSASWLYWDGTSFDELNAIRLDLISGTRSSHYVDSPWEMKSDTQ